MQLQDEPPINISKKKKKKKPLGLNPRHMNPFGSCNSISKSLSIVVHRENAREFIFHVCLYIYKKHFSSFFGLNGYPILSVVQKAVVSKLRVDILFQRNGTVVILGVRGVIRPAIGQHSLDVSDEETFVAIIVGL